MNLISRHAHWLAALSVWPTWGRSPTRWPTRPGQPDLDAFGALPVQDGGRLKPIDTFARTTMTAINSRQNFVKTPAEAGEKSYPPIEWLLAAWGQEPFTGKAAGYPCSASPTCNWWTTSAWSSGRASGDAPNDLKAPIQQFERDVERVQEIRKQDAAKLTAFDTNLLELGRHVHEYLQLANRREPAVVPPQADGQPWQSVGDIEREAAKPFADEARTRAVRAALADVAPGRKITELDKLTPEEADRVRDRAFDLFGRVMSEVGDRKRAAASPAAEAFVNLCRLYRAEKYDEFNAAVAAYRTDYLGHVPAADLTRVRFETFFNRAAPFFNCMILYVLAFVLVCGSWVLTALRGNAAAITLRRAAFELTAVTIVTHTAALIARMYLMNRWPSSSPTCIRRPCSSAGRASAWDWSLELFFGDGLGMPLASVIGARHAASSPTSWPSDGDTLEMLQAVLDTNFWLATHVTTVTLGYAATFVAGHHRPCLHPAAGVLTPVRSTADVREARSGQMIYGVALLRDASSASSAPCSAASGPTSRGAGSGAGTRRRTGRC